MSVLRITTDESLLKVTNATQVLRISSVGVQGAAGSQTVELVLSISGVVPTNQLIQRYVPTQPITFRPGDGHAILETATNQNMTMELRLQNGTVVGTVDWLTGQTVGSISMSQTAFADGEILDFHAPTTTDPALNTLTVVLPGDR